MTDSYPIREHGLVAAAIRGDAGAMRAVWQQQRRWIAAVLLAHKPREVDVEDLLQDVAVSFVKTIGTLRDEASLRPWLRTIAINAARASGRRARRLRLHGEVASGAEPEAPADVRDSGHVPGAAEREEAERLLNLAAELPDGYREPLLLKCVRGLSYRAISELMGLPETTIETRIARGRRMLRDLASGRGQAPGGGAETGSPKVLIAPPLEKKGKDQGDESARALGFIPPGKALYGTA